MKRRTSQGKTTRRQFLKQATCGASAAVLLGGCAAKSPAGSSRGTSPGGSGGSSPGGSGGSSPGGPSDCASPPCSTDPPVDGPPIEGHVFVGRGSDDPAQNVARALALAGGIARFIGSDDVVVLKPNGQWRNQGYTHALCLKALIDQILARPGGFTGEILVVEHVHCLASDIDNPEYCWNVAPGNRLNNWADMSYFELADDYKSRLEPVTFLPLFDPGVGDFHESYVTSPDELPEGKHGWGEETVRVSNGKTCYLSYPLLRSQKFDRIIDLKNGIWSAGAYTGKKARLIFLPTLNNHGDGASEDYAGPTSALKCHLGIVADLWKDTNLHDLYLDKPACVGEAIGHLITQILSPTFYMTCAQFTGHISRIAETAAHTKTIAIATDPVTLDTWTCKNVMLPAHQAEFGTGVTFMDPDAADHSLHKQLAGCHAKGVGTLDSASITVHS